VKEESDGQLPKVFDRALQVEDRLYMTVSFTFPYFFFRVSYEDLWLFADF